MVFVARLVRPRPLAVMVAVVTLTSMVQVTATAATDDRKSILAVADGSAGVLDQAKSVATVQTCGVVEIINSEFATPVGWGSGRGSVRGRAMNP